MFAVVLLALGVPTAAQAQTESVEYYALDALGSVRVVFDASGNVTARMDYGPFGEELSTRTGLPSRAYAGLFRDGEAGLDHAEARSYQSRSGRFTTTDPIYDGIFDPQRWNRYAYSLNNPISFSDPMGLTVPCKNTYSTTCFGSGNDPISPYSQSVAALLATWWEQMFGAKGYVRQQMERNRPAGPMGTATLGGSTTDDGQSPIQLPPSGQPPGQPPTPNPEAGLQGGPKRPCGLNNVLPQSIARRLPDYLHIQFSAGAWLNGSINFTMDKYGAAYFGLGGGFGRGLPVAAALTFANVPTRTAVGSQAFLSAWSIAGGGAAGPAYFSVTNLQSRESVNEFGVGTAQVSVGASYNWGGSFCH